MRSWTQSLVQPEMTRSWCISKRRVRVITLPLKVRGATNNLERISYFAHDGYSYNRHARIHTVSPPIVAPGAVTNYWGSAIIKNIQTENGGIGWKQKLVSCKFMVRVSFVNWRSNCGPQTNKMKKKNSSRHNMSPLDGVLQLERELQLEGVLQLEGELQL